MKCKTKNLTLFAATLLLTSISVRAATNSYRNYSQKLPVVYKLYHEAINQQYIVKAEVHISQFLDQEPIFTDILTGNERIIEFYDRAKLTADSYIDVGGRKARLTCLWINGQVNVSKGESYTFIRRMILVLDNNDCTGPITDLGDDRWDHYLELVVFDPYAPSLKEGNLVLNGGRLSLSLTPIEWNQSHFEIGM